MNRYYGKYRGSIANNVDPMMLGRVQVRVPAVLGDGTLSWAMPCTPFAGPGVGLFAVPPKDANVWVEFEGGDPDYPIWSGCFWGTGEVPAQPAIPEMKVFRTQGVQLTVNELPGSGGVTLVVSPPVVATPLKIVLSASGIELSNGAAKIALTPAGVNINDGALEVI
ncbi:baseplate assembly protein [Corallococcus exercitus]|uniref:Baseplate assembly protein n=1 Tax=Corallococcus exercitus TaxID=2316736 RepID=A0A7Y4NSX0_9BACT|nr:phage baseplate assembly protein V [Corallococcus exercitus]NOK34658.1 baseplate assembly protein [Corallococcus exercitus]